MPLFEETVPKWLYDQKCAEYDRLFIAYEKLRPTHSPVSPMKLIAPHAEGEQAVRQMDQALANPRIAAIAAKLKEERPDLSTEGALAEAKRLDDIARGKAVAK